MPYVEQMKKSCNPLINACFSAYRVRRFSTGFRRLFQRVHGCLAFPPSATPLSFRIDGTFQTVNFRPYVSDSKFQRVRFRLYVSDSTFQTVRFSQYVSDRTFQTVRSRQYVSDSTFQTVRFRRYVSASTF